MSDDPCTSGNHSEPIHPEAPVVIATPQQVLTGLIVGHSDQAVICAGCHDEHGEGTAVVVYAYRRADAHEWDVGRCYCQACAPEEITTPTLGATEVLATAVLGVRSVVCEQRHWCCLGELSIAVISPLTEGTAP